MPHGTEQPSQRIPFGGEVVGKKTMACGTETTVADDSLYSIYILSWVRNLKVQLEVKSHI